MITNNENLKYRIYAVIISVTGLICFIFGFITQFSSGENPYILLVFSTAAVIAGTFGNKKSNLIFLAVAVLYSFVFFSSLKIGFAMFFNSISESLDTYFKINTVYLCKDDIEVLRMDGEFIYPFMIFASYYLGYAFAKRIVMWLPTILIFSSFVFCVIIEKIPSGFIISLNLVYIIMALVCENAGKIKRKNVDEHAASLMAALISGGMIFLVLLVSMFVNPESTYERPDLAAKYGDTALAFYHRVQEFTKEGFWDQLINNVPASIGGGNIGDMDTVRYADKVVLSLKVPQEHPSIYLKAYVGADYTSKQWYRVDTEDYEDLFEELDNSDFHTQDMVPELLKTIVEENESSVAFSSFDLSVTNEDATTKFGYVPTYAYVDPDKYGMANDQPVYTTKQSDDQYTYYDFNTNIIPELESYLENTDNEKLIEFKEQELKYRSFVYAKYTEVNTTMSDELVSLWGLGYDSDTAEERLIVAAAIKKYLASNCKYTLSPGIVPDGKDFVEYFLKDTKEGYCTYFATAAVMMFRSAGIPARYVEGYLLKSSVSGDGTDFDPDIVNSYSGQSSGYYKTDYDSVDVLDSNGHAWVEFYIDGIGWIQYEVTPGNGHSTLPVEEETTSQKETIPNQSEPESTSGHEQETTKNSNAGTDHNTNEKTTTTASNNEGSPFKLDFGIIRTILKIIGIIIVLVLISAGIYLRHKLVDLRFKSLYNSDEPANKKLITLYRRFEMLMVFEGFRKSKFLQPEDFAIDIENRCKHVKNGEITGLIAVFQKASYSGSDMTSEEFKYAYDTMGDIRDRIYADLGIFRKIWFVYIRNL